MSVLFVCLLCLTVSLDAVTGAVSLLSAQEKPDEFAQEEGCYVPNLDLVLPYEEPYSPQDGSSCTQYTCRTDNITSIFTCGTIEIADGCVRVAGNYSLPYPECCDNSRCNAIED